MFSTPRGAARLMLIVVVALIVLKIAVAIITGSISILAQAADSSLDLVAVIITFITVRVATKPADEEHPFGHGKMENIAAAVQALLIFTAAGLIIYSALQRLQQGTVVALPEYGIGVMLVSMTASILLSRHLRRVARANDSLVLEANAHNITGDILSTAAVMLALVLVRFTGWVIVDPLIAITVALLILRSAYGVLRKAFGGLVDTRLPEGEEEIIKKAIIEHSHETVAFHNLRTRKAGRQRYVDLHLVMSRDTSLEEAHRMCDHLETDIMSKLPNSNVTIHVEPCSEECEHCNVVCQLRES